MAKKPEHDDSTVETIRMYAKDVDSKSAQVKVLQEEIDEAIEGANAYSEVTDLETKLYAAKQKLKIELQRTPTYVNACERMADLKEELKDSKGILSDYLVEHFVRTHERQVEINTINGDAREVVIKGRLGKKKKLQTSLFGSGVKVEAT